MIPESRETAENRADRARRSGPGALDGVLSGSLYWRGSRTPPQDRPGTPRRHERGNTCSLDSPAWSCSSSGWRWPRAPAASTRSATSARSRPSRTAPLVPEGRVRCRRRRTSQRPFSTTRTSASPTSSWATATTTSSSRPGRAKPENDADLTKAVENYRKAIDKLSGRHRAAGAEVPEALVRVPDRGLRVRQAERLRAGRAARQGTHRPSSRTNRATTRRWRGSTRTRAGTKKPRPCSSRRSEVKPERPARLPDAGRLLQPAGRVREDHRRLPEARRPRAEQPGSLAHDRHASTTTRSLRDKPLPLDTSASTCIAGIAAEDKALALNPEYYEALTYKNILLRPAGQS